MWRCTALSQKDGARIAFSLRRRRLTLISVRSRLVCTKRYLEVQTTPLLSSVCHQVCRADRVSQEIGDDFLEPL
jgi:hypothetical protein